MTDPNPNEIQIDGETYSSVSNETIREQIKRNEQNIRTYRHVIKKVTEKRDEYKSHQPRFAGQIDAFQTTIVKIQEHIGGIRKLHEEGQLSEEELKVALRWTNEVLGIPGNLVEEAKINLRRAEGATFACEKQIADLEDEIRNTQAAIRGMETMGERVDDLDQRKAEAAKVKAAEADESQHPLRDDGIIVSSPMNTA